MKEGRQSFLAKKPVYLRSSYTIVGPKEGDGNFGECFDTVLRDDLWGEKSYEKAESKMHREAIRGAICLAGLDFDGIDLMLAAICSTRSARPASPCVTLRCLSRDFTTLVRHSAKGCCSPPR